MEWVGRCCRSCGWRCLRWACSYDAGGMPRRRRRNTVRFDLILRYSTVAFGGCLEPRASGLDTPVAPIARILVHLARDQFVVVLLVANRDVPFVALAPVVDQLHFARAVRSVRRAFPDALTGRYTDAATIAHEIHAYHIPMRVVLAVGGLGLGRTLIDQTVPLSKGVLLRRGKCLLPGVVGPEI